MGVSGVKVTAVVDGGVVLIAYNRSGRAFMASDGPMTWVTTVTVISDMDGLHEDKIMMGVGSRS